MKCLAPNVCYITVCMLSLIESFIVRNESFVHFIWFDWSKREIVHLRRHQSGWWNVQLVSHPYHSHLWWSPRCTSHQWDVSCNYEIGFYWLSCVVRVGSDLLAMNHITAYLTRLTALPSTTIITITAPSLPTFVHLEDRLLGNSPLEVVVMCRTIDRKSYHSQLWWVQLCHTSPPNTRHLRLYTYYILITCLVNPLFNY
jgi:hypothetical protein